MLGDAGRFNGLAKSWCVCAMSISGIRLGDVCDGRDNNFNLIRMVAAFSVLVSHAWPLSLGAGATEPLSLRFSYSLGGLAVIVFFGISGFLITRSFDRQPAGRWASARVLRLAPGLFVALALTVVVLGPIVSAWPPGKYWTNGQTYTYVYRNLTLYQMQPKLSGLFLDNPYPAAVNGSLWTLYYEVLCYIAVGALGVLGFVRRRLWMALAFGVFAVAYLTVLHVLPADAVSNRLQWTFRFALPFAIGAAFWIWRNYLRLTPAVMALLVVVTYFARATPAFEVLTVFTLLYGVFLVGYRVSGPIRTYNRLGDYSYGVYIYAFPVEQTVAHFLKPLGPMLEIAVAAPVTLALAVLSWNLVEKRALSLTRLWPKRRTAGASIDPVPPVSEKTA